ncbi:Uncharacterised protein [Mycobacteroides abscessus subsp. abscessus]|nr:Uncharacterised protein [Mycobacteroides abscessus subsp. abscessus]
MSPDPRARTTFGESFSHYRRTDPAVAGGRRHHQFGHRRGVLGGRLIGHHQIEECGHIVAILGNQVLGAGSPQLAQYLFTHRGDAVDAGGLDNQLADL